MIYLIQVGDNGPVKIGVAADVQRRLEWLQTASPYPLNLVGVLRGSFKKERELHEQLSSRRLKGEWFENCTEVQELISSALPPSKAKTIDRRDYDRMKTRVDAMREKGWSFTRIGAKLGISRQRAHQIYRRKV